MIRITLALVLLLPNHSKEQAVGSGISKHTWAASDPRACYNWMKKFLPVREEYGSCDDGQCECATQGRLALAGYTGAPPRVGPWGFGLHTVNCSFHPHGELSLADVETIFQEKFGDWSQLDGFMEYNLGLWSHDLTPIVRLLEEANEQFLTLSWRGGEGSWRGDEEEGGDGEGVGGEEGGDEEDVFFSLIFSPCGYVVFELISDTLDLAGINVVQHPNPRMIWKEWNNDYVAEMPYLTPIKVSRSVSNMDAILPFYVDTLGSSIVHQESFSDGSEVLILNAPQSKVHLQFWSGVPTKPGWEAYDLEIYINNVHDEHMIGPFCGFDQWIDNHIAIDAGPGEDGTGPTLDKLVPLLEQGGYHYHIWGGATGNDSTGYDKLVTVYGADPLGWGVQFDYPYFNSPDNLPFYTTTCKSNDGCSGQGFCDFK